ncbi:UNVERIFIED_CONTAM: hypothetical protein Slati_3776900 [Sesamum latifolium]|uniref:RNase H type-1 domain-containing protein n=1 Tax=Sesamum latifolium TaxID=2727402 RepID=A0AAW2U5A9_9LAMI
MKAPTCLNEAQRLTGRIAALSRFISKSAKKSLPFFKTLRKAKTFEWGCQLRTHSGRNGKKLPIYYVSKVLNGAEGRYTPIEKMALALVVTARRLRPYFLSHPIGVRTNTPLKQTNDGDNHKGGISRSEVVLHVDGSSTAQGSGAGIVITTPQGEDLEFAIKFDFKASNNEAEYEALVIGLRMAHETGAKHLLAYSDSQLVVKQVEGTYEAKEEKEGIHILQEVHSGCCGAHVGTRILANKALRAGYFWPTMKQDAIRLTMGIDIVGPFPLAVGQRKFLLVAVDYFTKWVEAESLARITEGEACTSSKDSPQWLILRPMGKLRSQIASWTTPRGSTGETPFSLVYGTEAIIPAELGMPSHRVMNFSEECNENLLRENLDLIEELREKAFLRAQRYKNIMISSYNIRVKSRNFQVGDLVLRRVDALKPISKLDPTWEGPYKAGPSASLGPKEEGEVPSGTEAGAGGASEGPAGGIAGAFSFFSVGSPSLGTTPSMESVAATGEDSSLLPPLHLGGYQGHPLIKETDDG